MVIQRGEVWWAALPEPVGSAPGYDRPVVVVQANRFNRSKIRTVLVATVTSSMAHAHLPGNVFLSKKQSGLPKDSVVNLTQMIAIDRDLLSEKVGELPPRIMTKVNKCLNLVLALH